MHSDLRVTLGSGTPQHHARTRATPQHSLHVSAPSLNLGNLSQCSCQQWEPSATCNFGSLFQRVCQQRELTATHTKSSLRFADSDLAIRLRSRVCSDPSCPSPPPCNHTRALHPGRSLCTKRKSSARTREPSYDAYPQDANLTLVGKIYFP
jgi:hypothetical protein